MFAFVKTILNILITVLSVAGVSIGQWLGFVLGTLPDTLRCFVNVRQGSEIDSMNESTQDGSTYPYLGKAITGWACNVR